MLLQNYSYLKVPQYIREVLDEIGGKNRSAEIYTGVLYIFIYTVVLAVSLFLMRKLIIGVSRKIEYLLREKIYHKLLALEYLFFQQNETGDLMSRCTNDLNHVRTLLGPAVMYIPNSTTRLIIFLPVLIGLSGPLMKVLGLLMVFLVVVILVLLPLLRPLFRQIQEYMGKMNNRVWQVISGISSIKRYTAETIEIDRFRKFNEEYIKKQMAVVKLQGSLRPLFFFIFSLSEMIILLVGGKQVINGQLTMGELLQFNIMVAQLAFPVLSLAWIMSLMQQGISAMNRINYLLDQPEKEQDRTKTLSDMEPELMVRELNFTYPGAGQEVLKNINLSVAPGQSIGITGPVGSGKSTLLDILTGLVKPGPGQVYVGGNDIVDLNLASLHRKIAVVSQDPFLFSRTVAENIALGPGEMTIEAIRKAAENAGLKKDIEGFNDGYQQEVGERGITLSGGQKQRVAIARALGKEAPILVLDDPLSNVDARTETRILENLESLKGFRILIIVSHRVSVLKNVGTIYVMDNGAIVEEGSHEQLVNRKGLYSRLARMQQMEMELDEQLTPQSARQSAGQAADTVEKATDG
ncbi:MAG: ABC transporter ATP-binding protein [bacterium]|nr:ABC transporter ATP-binding protein [bacterium]